MEDVARADLALQKVAIEVERLKQQRAGAQQALADVEAEAEMEKLARTDLALQKVVIEVERLKQQRQPQPSQSQLLCLNDILEDVGLIADPRVGFLPRTLEVKEEPRRAAQEESEAQRAEVELEKAALADLALQKVVIEAITNMP